MKKLFLFILIVVCTSFTVDSIDSLNISNPLNSKDLTVSDTTISNFEISVNEIEYSRNIDSVSYLVERRKTGTKYSINLESSTVNVKFSDGSSVYFDSVSVEVNKGVYEISFFDKDLYGNASHLYSTIIVDIENNSVDYIERNLDYVDDYNRYKFIKFDLKLN